MARKPTRAGCGYYAGSGEAKVMRNDEGQAGTMIGFSSGTVIIRPCRCAQEGAGREEALKECSGQAWSRFRSGTCHVSISWTMTPCGLFVFACSRVIPCGCMVGIACARAPCLRTCRTLNMTHSVQVPGSTGTLALRRRLRRLVVLPESAYGRGGATDNSSDEFVPSVVLELAIVKPKFRQSNSRAECSALAPTA